jgi:hypothetical protein
LPEPTSTTGARWDAWHEGLAARARRLRWARVPETDEDREVASNPLLPQRTSSLLRAPRPIDPQEPPHTQTSLGTPIQDLGYVHNAKSPCRGGLAAHLFKILNTYTKRSRRAEGVSRRIYSRSWIRTQSEDTAARATVSRRPVVSSLAGQNVRSESASSTGPDRRARQRHHPSATGKSHAHTARAR